MRDWGFLPSAQDLEAVSAAARLYRDHCASFRLPTRAAFDGSIDDVATLDYLGYEGIGPRGAGIEISALICGEVLRRAAGFEWVISYRGDWFVATPDEHWPAIAICPLARLHEMECGGRGSGMHMRFLQEAAFDCLLYCEPDAEPRLRALLAGGDYLASVARTLGRLGHQVRPPLT